MNKAKYISVCFNDEEDMLRAVRILRENERKILDVLTPFPVHGLDEELSIRRSKIPVGGFIFGFLGAVLAFGFQAWVFTVSYPLIFGGKPFFAAPSFIPITFECTVLFAGLSMAAAFLIRSRLKPEITFDTDFPDITDDMFVIFIDADNSETSVENVELLLSGIRKTEIRKHG